jgi:selenocysteine lyase/cysteine desulfurase
MRPSSLETHFAHFRAQIIGIDQTFESPRGTKRLLYADWTASGRAYRPIETALQEEILPFFANTHTETSFMGVRITAAYEAAKQLIKTHVHAGHDDALVFCGSGMTAAVNKLQRIMGLRLPSWALDRIRLEEPERPLVLVTHMEHHSNQISWLETIATVKVVPPGEDGNVDLQKFRQLLEQYRHRRLKIAAITACSNVTGIGTPYHAIAAMMHQHDGFCFVDFAAAAPYTAIDIHPENPQQSLDAIYFSGHKFLGGPGTPGILIFNKALYTNSVPDQPGGGTLLYSNPWGAREYVDDIEQREDGGTPPILQAIKAGMAIRLKEEMGIENIRAREAALTKRLLQGLSVLPGIQVLAPANEDRLGIVSFIVKNGHYNTVVQDLNDRHGIQCRGGCSCAGTYGHFLLGIDAPRSYAILDRLRAGDRHAKPGWVRLSIHPTTSDAEIDYLLDVVASVVASPRPPDHPDDVSCPTWQTSKAMISL